MMIEKILKRFMTEEGVVVLAAMEKVGGTEKCDVYDMRSQYRHMYDRARESGNWADRRVLYSTYQRLERVRERAKARSTGLDIAGKILMGETFERDKSQHGVASQAQYQQMMGVGVAQGLLGQSAVQQMMGVGAAQGLLGQRAVQHLVDAAPSRGAI